VNKFVFTLLIHSILLVWMWTSGSVQCF